MIIVVTLPAGVNEAQAQGIVRQLSASGAPMQSVALYRDVSELIAEQQLARGAPMARAAGPMPMGGAIIQGPEGAATGSQVNPMKYR